MAYQRRQRRQRRRRNIARRHPVMKAVAKRVVKVALSRQVERKRLPFTFTDLSASGLTFYYRNLLAPIVQGTAETTRLGDKINNVRLNMSLTWAFTGRGSTGTLMTTGAPLRVMVIKSRKQLPTAGNAYASTPSSSPAFPMIMADTYHVINSPINTHDYTVLYDKLVYSHLPATESPYPRGNTVVHRFSLQLAKEFRFSDSDPLYGKLSNLYLIIGTSYQGATTSDYAGYVQSSGYLSWNDA